MLSPSAPGSPPTLPWQEDTLESEAKYAQASVRLSGDHASLIDRYSPKATLEETLVACWTFLSECVFTLDQISGACRPFPDRDYALYLTGIWLREPLLAVPKSRRMFATWHFCALHYWLARFGMAGSKIAMVSRKECRNKSEGSAELLWRIEYIHNHLPKNLPRFTLEATFCRLAFPDNGSEIIGVGQGENQLRQHTLTAIFFDEFAFWEHALETYMAARPTIEGGGKLTICSSASPGAFKQLVHDEM